MYGPNIIEEGEKKWNFNSIKRKIWKMEHQGKDI